VHDWVFATPSGQRMLGNDPGDLVAGTDDEFFEAGVTGIGATIMGRNMFGPVRGEWGDSDWAGWWGPEPPYHHPVFVLTHHAHDPIEMVGTTFFFVTDGIESALKQATDAAAGDDIRLGGGASTVRQYLEAGLVDELHLPVAPVLLGSGERIFDGDTRILDGYDCEIVVSPRVAHFRFTRA
jgi:dihydrofolate reductase